jgi:hypothetical protein
MRVAYIDLSPSEERLAKASIDFLFFETLKPEFQSLIGYLAVLPKLGRYEAKLSEAAKMVAEDIQKKLRLPHDDRFVDEVVNKFPSIYISRIMHVYHPTVRDYVLIWVINTDNPVDSFYRLTSAVLVRYVVKHRLLVERAYISLAEDTNIAQLIDSLVEALEMLGLGNVVKTAQHLIEMASEHIATLLSDAVALNYFIFLNTKPFTSVFKLCAAAPELLIPVRCIGIAFIRAILIYNLLNIAKQLTSLSKDIASELHNLVDKVAKSIEEEVPTPRFASVAHLVYEEVVANHPKNVYISKRSKYEVIFKDINWDVIRRRGVPALDSM